MQVRTLFSRLRPFPWLLLALCWVLGTFGCASNLTVEVDLTGLTACAEFQVSASLAGQLGDPAEYRVWGGSTILPLITLPENANGALQIEVYCLDATGCIIAHGSGGSQVRGPGTYQIAIPLGQAAGCTVASGTGWDLTGIWGSGPSDLWAAAAGGSYISSHEALLHWDGSAWTAVHYVQQLLFAGWSSGPSDGWAVGDQGTVLHWDGSAWSPVFSGTLRTLRAVWGSAPGDVWAVGDQGTVLHWDGSAWTPVPSGTSVTLIRVWGSGPSDIWAVGDGRGSLWHWDGSTWANHSVPSDPYFVLRDVSASAPDDVWAVGSGCETELPSHSLISGCAAWHWDGATWIPNTNQIPGGFSEVWGSGRNDVWAVTELSAVMHWNGSAWAPVPALVFPTSVHLWGPGPSDVWLVGSFGAMVHYRL